MNEIHEYSLIKADQRIYAKYFATYRKNIWFRPSWIYLQTMMEKSDDCYWAIYDGKRVAGISLSENTIGSLFMLPPYVLSAEIVSFLRDYTIEISNRQERIDAFNVLPEHLDAFTDKGFQIVNTRKCMIRPTEIIAVSEIETIVCSEPSVQHHSSIVSLMEQAYAGGLNQGDINNYTRDITYYFEHNSKEELLGASSVIFDKATGELVGVCLISLWEDIPLVYEIAVKPSYSNQGLGKYMLRRAISYLEKYYSVIRLFVTIGNPAEHLYNSLGFLSGDETSQLVYKV